MSSKWKKITIGMQSTYPKLGEIIILCIYDKNRSFPNEPRMVQCTLIKIVQKVNITQIIFDEINGDADLSFDNYQLNYLLYFKKQSAMNLPRYKNEQA